MKTHFANFVFIFCVLFTAVSDARDLQPLPAAATLPDDILAPEDVSAVAMIGSFLAIGSDEGVGAEKNKNYIQLLNKGADDRYRTHNNILLLEGNATDGKELDLEGLAAEGDRIYAVGSHSSKRKKVDAAKKYKKNREKFQDDYIADEKNRDWLYRVTIDAEGNAISTERITLRAIIENHAVLKTFKNIPSKEHGVDIEGLAVKGDWLYVGFRGPVFRENYVPVLKLKFDDPQGTNELLYVNLGGHGVRDLTSVSDGFLLLAGPVGDGPGACQLYHWDGKDVIPGDEREDAVGTLRLLGEIRPPRNGKAEGVAVLEEADTFYRLIIVYDGVENKDEMMRGFRVDKLD